MTRRRSRGGPARGRRRSSRPSRVLGPARGRPAASPRAAHPTPPLSTGFVVYVEQVLVPALRPGDVMVTGQPAGAQAAEGRGGDRGAGAPCCTCRRTARTSTRSSRGSRSSSLGVRHRTTQARIVERMLASRTVSRLRGCTSRVGRRRIVVRSTRRRGERRSVAWAAEVRRASGPSRGRRGPPTRRRSRRQPWARGAG
jgi:hypothetical protein